MPFCIIETLEPVGAKLKRFCQTVPESWVYNNVLSWPPNDLLQKKTIQNEIPPQKTWKKMACKVLRRNISKYPNICRF